MKTNVFLLASAVLMLFSCKKNDPDIIDFKVSQAYTDINFYFETSGKNISSVEISYGENEQMLNEKTIVYNHGGGNETKTIEELGLVVGSTYYFRAKAISQKGKESEWTNMQSILIGTLCGEAPINVSTSTYSLYWADPNPQDNNVSFYEVEYGEIGFTQGTGTVAQTNTKSFDQMLLEQGKTYDFYVRSFCNNGYGFSDWNGPNSLYADQNRNLCMAPDYASYAMHYDFFGDPSSVEVTFSDPGNCQNFEVNIVNDGQSPTANPTSFIESKTVAFPGLSYPAQYDFYVRVICIDNSTTAWYGPLDINYQ